MTDLTPTMRLLVCGGRDFCDRATLDSALLFYTQDARENGGRIVVIHGDARGADRMAGEWAARNGYDVAAYPADWGAHGKSAGFIRNARMLTEGKPDFVVAFPGGRGTADMVRRSRAAGLRVFMPQQPHLWMDGSEVWLDVPTEGEE